ncbi:MAG: hypothetical protein GWN11_04140 [Candidatus Dadabacteria bacterium]|nr:hypothetical protein [Candidatus Dadabacteria bacterium]NIX15072.1 hypothetical protein [Candidatus Dadabacteria bacterium]
MSIEPKSEVEELMNTYLPFAKQMREKDGEFIPYGAAITQDNQIIAISDYDENDMPPVSEDRIELLRDVCRKTAADGRFKASAIFYDVIVIPPGSFEKTDAIAVELDHEESYSVIVFFPYKIVNSIVEFGDIYAEPGNNDIFK